MIERRSMYYLEDRHPEFEYGCYIKVGNAIPYISPWRATNKIDVYRFIHDIEKKHARTGQHFFIDNDFYVNHYKERRTSLLLQIFSSTN